MWAPGKKVDRFKLERIIGQGGFGMTYLAKDTSLTPPAYCVIKTLRTDLKDFEVQQTKFRQEALNLARCSHPHVVAVRDVIKEDGIWALVMDYVDGDNLATVIRDNPAERLPEAEALRYIDQIGQALECVHDRGLLHRDVKPLNIMIRRDTGNAILIDFGLARDFTLDSSRSMTAMMTEGFAPIEQYDRRGVFGPYTDVYALASTLYCMLTGEAPLFNAKGRKEARDEGKSIDDFMWNKLKAAGVSSRVLRAIMWGMEVLTTDRPQSVQEWRDALGLVSRSIPQGVQFEATVRYSEKAQQELQHQVSSRVIPTISTVASPSISPPAEPVQSNRKDYKITPLKIGGAIMGIIVTGSVLFKVIFPGTQTTQIEEIRSQESSETSQSQLSETSKKDEEINTAQKYSESCNKKRENKSIDEALIDCDKAIEIDPKYAIAYNSRGLVRKDISQTNSMDKEKWLKQANLAIADYNKAIKINPNYADAYHNRGFIKSNINQNRAALSDFNKAIKLNPNNLDSYTYRGHVKSSLGMKEEAEADWGKGTNPFDTPPVAH